MSIFAINQIDMFCFRSISACSPSSDGRTTTSGAYQNARTVEHAWSIRRIVQLARPADCASAWWSVCQNLAPDMGVALIGSRSTAYCKSRRIRSTLVSRTKNPRLKRCSHRWMQRTTIVATMAAIKLPDCQPPPEGTIVNIQEGCQKRKNPDWGLRIMLRWGLRRFPPVHKWPPGPPLTSWLVRRICWDPKFPDFPCGGVHPFFIRFSVRCNFSIPSFFPSSNDLSCLTRIKLAPPKYPLPASLRRHPAKASVPDQLHHPNAFAFKMTIPQKYDFRITLMRAFEDPTQQLNSSPESVRTRV